MPEHNELYHPNRIPLGQTIARNAAQPPHTYRIGACICLFNPHDEMLIQQRHPQKTDWPERWDVSAGGLAQPGETSQQAATRELHEELGIHHDFSHTTPVLTLTHDDEQPCFDDYYLLHAAPDLAQLTLQSSEVIAVRWANLAAIHSLLAAGQFIPYHPALLEYLFHRARSGSVYHSP